MWAACSAFAALASNSAAPWPPGGRGAALLLAKAANEEQAAHIGKQTGGRVFLFLHTDDFDRTVERVQALGGSLTEAVRHEVYGRVVVLLDLYGNKWDLIEPATGPT